MRLRLVKTALHCAGIFIGENSLKTDDKRIKIRRGKARAAFVYQSISLTTCSGGRSRALGEDIMCFMYFAAVAK